MKLITHTYGGGIEPTALLIWLVVLPGVIISITILAAIVLTELDRRGKLHPAVSCLLFHGGSRIVTHTGEGDFVKCLKCGLTHWCQK